MTVSRYNVKLLLYVLTGLCAATAQAQFDPDHGPGFELRPVQGQNHLDGLIVVTSEQWTEAAVRRVLQSFAFGGHASSRQVARWAAMNPQIAINQMLNFNLVNTALSAPDPNDSSGAKCHSMTELQTFWGSDDPANPVRKADRQYCRLLSDNMLLRPVGLYFTWARAMQTHGCNLFLHKMAFYLTNYHASIHIDNAGVALIRDYYDDTVRALSEGEDFIGLMFQAASNGALAFAYGHASNYVHPFTGVFNGNDDFAREYFQLLFGIEGTSEDPEYHEGVTIENNAKLLTGMAPDLLLNRFGSMAPFDWLSSDLEFTDHVDSTGRQVYNRSAHFDFRLGPASCLEILHQPICGSTAEEKLRSLGPVAASHPESMASVPLKLVRFFADTVITAEEQAALQLAWADAGFDLLKFVRAYAISTQFHDPSTWKYWSAFERNLIVHNATILDNQESFARPEFYGSLVRMFEQGVLPFAPIRDVFGGQTGNDAANDRFVFKNAWSANVENPEVLASVIQYQPRAAGGFDVLWQKNWSSEIPRNANGEYVVREVAEWLWNRLIADGGAQFDDLARAQVYSLLATGFDFVAVLGADGPPTVLNSADLQPGTIPNLYMQMLAGQKMDLAVLSQQHQVGMATNFISMLPYAFATGGVNP